MQDSSLHLHLTKQRCGRVWGEDVKGGAFQAVRFDPFRGAGEEGFAVVIESQNERSVDLDTIVVQDAPPPRVVAGLRRLFVRVGKIVVGERFEADEDAGAS